MGLVGMRFCVIVFSEMGDLIEVQEWPVVLPPPATFRHAGELDDWLYGIVEREVTQVRTQEGLADETIRVKRFRLPKLQVGIDDLPDDLQEYVANRGSSPTEEDLEEGLEGWKEESLFIFWWDADYYVNDQGLVTSS